MPASPIFPLANKALGGSLEQRLRDARANGLSFNKIALDLHDEDINVSAETVRVWCRDLQIEAA